VADATTPRPGHRAEIKHVDSADRVAVERARSLFEEYQRAIGVDLCFQQFDRELASLPGDYAPPRGCLLLAYGAGRPIGCVALRPLEDDVAELKRLYVRPHARQGGVGRKLVARVLDEARRLGYRCIRLDTLPSMQEAQRLYELFGFRQIPPYTQNPVEGARFMEVDLRA
jgi:putative acetyltransferase